MPSRPRRPSPARQQTVSAAGVPHQMTPPVTGPDRTPVVALPAEPAGVSVARHWATALLTLWGVSADDLGTAQLGISELAANAV